MSDAPAARQRYALVLAADEGFALGLAIALHSALVTLSRRVMAEIFVLDNGLSASARERVLRVVRRVDADQEVHWIQVPPDRLRHLAIADQFSSATYSRLLIPELLPPRIQRAIYLDADVLVRDDLSPLFAIELSGAPFAAVRDFVIDSTDHESSGIRDPQDSRPYFNGGVLVIDVPRWRDMQLGNRALEYVAAGSEPLRWADQDALNAVEGNWLELDYRWNLQLARLFHREGPPAGTLAARLYNARSRLYRDAAVVHFTGQKPWRGTCVVRGRGAWLRSLITARWHSPLELLAWLSGYAAEWGRHELGTLRERLRGSGRRMTSSN